MSALARRHLHSVPAGAGAAEPLWLQVAEAAERAQPTDPCATFRLMGQLLEFMPQDDPRTLYHLGHAAMRAENYAAATTFLEFSIKRGITAPHRGVAYLELTSALRRIDQVSTALEYLEQGMHDAEIGSFADDLAAFEVVILHDAGQHRAAAHTAVSRLSPHLDELIPDLLP